MELKDYINEAISSGKMNSDRSNYPDSDSEKDIIAWLERNGYKKVDNEGMRVYSRANAKRLSKNETDKVYILGNHNDSPGTHWIEFGNCFRMYFVRTGEFFNHTGTLFLQRFTTGNERTFRTFKDMLDFIIHEDPNF